MKKVLCAVVAAAIMAVSATSVFAAGINADEKAILDSIKAGVSVNNVTYSVPAEYVNQAENYLATVDVTADQAKEIMSCIDEVKAVVKADGATSLSAIKTATKNKVMEVAKKAAAVLDLKLTFSSDKTVTITNSAGEVVFKGDNVVKATGAEADMTNAAVISIAVLATIALCGAGAYKLGLLKD